MTELKQGIVVNLLAGYYDVQLGNQLVRTRARGVFRKRGQKPRVGDVVDVQLDEQGTNYLVAVKQRSNLLGRPAVANVAGILLVISAVEPDYTRAFLDRYLVYFAWQHVPVTLYLSKSDLITPDKLAQIKQDLDYYAQIGYHCFIEQAKLKQALPKIIGAGQVWTLAGQSGAGKSTLLNFLKTEAHQATAPISSSLHRGRHTTRQVSLFSLGKGFLADTPGFSALDLGKIKLTDLASYFVEFAACSRDCKFRSCQHLSEPGCAVKAGLQAGKIAAWRYDDYLALRQEIADTGLPDYLKK
ncbi:MAG: ribosome small subunit-dependent GTPase A [Lactobacillus sp.]|nr:ribosome small subunit-dependent GTPase A [Lactobacillus sp.]